MLRDIDTPLSVVNGILAGDTAAWEVFVAVYATSMTDLARMYAARWNVDASEADEAVQRLLRCPEESRRRSGIAASRPGGKHEDLLPGVLRIASYAFAEGSVRFRHGTGAADGNCLLPGAFPRAETAP